MIFERDAAGVFQAARAQPPFGLGRRHAVGTPPELHPGSERRAPGETGDEQAARLEDPRHLIERAPRITQVLRHVAGQHQVEDAVGIRELVAPFRLRVLSSSMPIGESAGAQ